MRDFAIVKKIEGQLVQVAPMISDACISCNSSDCEKQGKTFSVINKQNFDIKENSVVKIGVSKASQCLQGIAALLIPILCAALSQRLGMIFSEGFQAVTVLAFFLTACIVVFVISRSSIHITLPEITQVL